MSHREVIAADMRQTDVWELGGVMHDPYRVAKIAAKHDWHRLLTPELEDARALYDKFYAPEKPPFLLMAGAESNGYSRVTSEQLLAVWRERRNVR